MYPAQVLDLTQSGYTHKKFGTRSSPPLTFHIIQKICENQKPLEINKLKDQTNETTSIKKRSKGDIFRPYALEENTRTRSLKRKRQELQDEEWQQHQQSPYSENIHAKKFAAASPPSITHNKMSTIFLPPMSVNLPYMPLPYHGPLQYQFNAQALAVMLQKQQIALCMGEILKRQPDFNLYNIIGN